MPRCAPIRPERRECDPRECASDVLIAIFLDTITCNRDIISCTIFMELCASQYLAIEFLKRA